MNNRQNSDPPQSEPFHESIESKNSGEEKVKVRLSAFFVVVSSLRKKATFLSELS